MTKKNNERILKAPIEIWNIYIYLPIGHHNIWSTCAKKSVLLMKNTPSKASSLMAPPGRFASVTAWRSVASRHRSSRSFHDPVHSYVPCGSRILNNNSTQTRSRKRDNKWIKLKTNIMHRTKGKWPSKYLIKWVPSGNCNVPITAYACPQYKPVAALYALLVSVEMYRTQKNDNTNPRLR